MFKGTWLKTDDGRDIYIVDYPDLLIPPRYDDEEQKISSEAFKKYNEFFRNFAKENEFDFIANGKKF